jgi:Dolichyl-phosphate-mannose-protein mannosyltransferase
VRKRKSILDIEPRPPQDYRYGPHNERPMTAAAPAKVRASETRDEAGAPVLDLRLVAAFAVGTILVHFLFNGRYGYFRDELYFMACGDHLAWGYVDMPPMVALVARVSRALFGDSLFAIRLFPALAGGATVALAGVLTCELGGRRFAQALAMLTVATAPLLLAVGNFLSMNAFDPLLWTGCAYVLVCILKGGDPRLWLAFGAIAGIGLENKESMLFFGSAIVAGLILTPERKVLLSRWMCLGGLLAFLIFLPTLLWQAAHHFPMLEELANVKASTKNAPMGPLAFLSAQILMAGPVAAPVWMLGLYLFFTSGGGRFRALGWTYVVMAAEFIILHGKAYYIGPIYPTLFAAGAVQIEDFVAESRLEAAIVATLATFAIIIAPMAIPILPVETFIKYQRLLHIEPPRTETRKLAELPQLYADMFGWKNMTATVARVYNSLPPQERAEAAIFASNYGEAGAIDFFGPRYGLPKAISGHMNYYLWGPRNYSGKIVIAIGGHEQRYRQLFASVEQAATIQSKYAMPDENDLPVFILRDPKLPLNQLWPMTKQYI